MLPWGSREDRPDYDWADGVTLRCFELPDGYGAETVVPGHDGAPATAFRVRRDGGRIVAESTDARAPWSLQVGDRTASVVGAGTVSLEVAP